MVRLINAFIAAVAVAIPLLFCAGAQAQPTKIRISWVAVPNNLPPLFMEKPEVMTRVGQSYTIDAIRFPGTPQSVAALASGELDIALLTFSSFPLAIQNAKLEDLRVIGDEFIDGVEGHYSAEFLVLKDGPIQKVEDLKGKTVAVNVRGGGTDMALRAITKKHGLEEKRDFTTVEVAFANMKATLLEKKVDLVGLGVPAFSVDPVLRSQVRPLFAAGAALLYRSEEPRRGRQHRVARHQAAARAARPVAVHQGRLLSLTGWCARHQCPAEQHQVDGRPGLPQVRRGREEVSGLLDREGCRRAAEVTALRATANPRR
jgi:hypothetical protein